MPLTHLRESPEARAGAVGSVYLQSPLSGSHRDASLPFFQEMASPVAEPPSAVPGLQTPLSAALFREEGPKANLKRVWLSFLKY